ncbi:oxidoreductase [uncultured Marivita sp.]|uniref:oxidoreductase n=1 Tax=uncultured Marivita sp. TaxID=888080 RepID=UPI00261930AC|nr:oxidoreductase [uncultured Marivita sp.]
MTKTAIVTGGAQGIGLASAERLARDGIGRVYLIDVQRDRLDEAVGAVEALGAEAHGLAIDLSDAGTLIGEVDALVAGAGSVDILVNAAGSTARGGITDTTPETYDHLYAINLRAPFFMMQRVLPAMNKGGTIVNICSMLAYGGPPFLLGYSSTKAALVALTRGVANTVKRQHIRVFGINLGWTWTPGEQETQTKVHGLPDNWRDTVGAKQPFGRLLMPEDPANLIAFLVSDEASMMTGAVIDLDQFVAGTVDDNPGA